MSYDCHGIIVISFLLFTSANSCWNTRLDNRTYGHIESLNFFLGEAQTENISCSWMINNERLFQSYYIISLRIIQLENDPTVLSNELILQSDQEHIVLDDINQRTFYLPSSSALEIYYRTKSVKSKSNSLNIRRFLLEFIYIGNDIHIYNKQDYFHCLKSGLIIPKRWKCNCLYECLYDDDSDEHNCPLCSLMKSSNSLLCHSNESWCLPKNDKIDPNGNNHDRNFKIDASC